MLLVVWYVVRYVRCVLLMCCVLLWPIFRSDLVEKMFSHTESYSMTVSVYWGQNEFSYLIFTPYSRSSLMDVTSNQNNRRAS